MKFLVVVVDRGKVEQYTDLLNKNNDKVQFVSLARGTASSEMLDYFGLSETEKAVIFCIVDNKELKSVFNDLKEQESIYKNGAVAFTIPISNINKGYFDLVKSLIINHMEEDNE